MRRILCVALVVMMVLGIASCSKPAAETTAVPTPQPTASIAQALSPEDAAIANASTADKLRALVEQYKSDKNYGALYKAALKLIEADPAYAAGYTDAALALLEMSKANYAEIDRILAQGAKSAKESAGEIADWVKGNEPNLVMAAPSIPGDDPAEEINTVGITPGNLANKILVDAWKGGLLTSQGDWIYYAAVSDNFAIYRVKKDGKSPEKLAGDKGDRACCLNAVGDWLYYCNSSDGGKVYRMRLDGSERAKIGDDSVEFLSVADGWMYYCNISDNGCLYRMRPDGSERTKLDDAFVMAPCVFGDWVYYMSKKEGGFWRVKTDGSAKEELSGQTPSMWVIEGEWIYYQDGKDATVIGRMRLDGSGNEEIYKSDMPVYTFNVGADRIFAAVGNKKDVDRIIVVPLDTRQPETIAEKGTDLLCLAPGGWLYYTDWGDGKNWYRMDLKIGEIAKLE